jgi:hypothetical protein
VRPVQGQSTFIVLLVLVLVLLLHLSPGTLGGLGRREREVVVIRSFSELREQFVGRGPV